MVSGIGSFDYCRSGYNGLTMASYWEIEVHDYGLLIKVLREWDVEVVHLFSKYLNENLPAHPAPHLAIDFCNINYVDSLVLGMLVQLARRCQAKNGELFILQAHRNLQKLFQHTGLERQFRVFANESELQIYLGEKNRGNSSPKTS